MKIIKYPHSCVMIETNGKKFLFDPGDINYKEEFFEQWENSDYIFVTHRHGDHCYTDVLKNFDMPIYSTKEVSENHKELKVSIVKSGDIIDLGQVKVEVVNAVHGYLPKMKGKSIKENVGYILDDGYKRVYITSDTMCFENDYKADILFGCVSGHVCMTEYELSLFGKALGAELLIPIHMESPLHPVDIEKVKRTFEEFEINYRVMENGESLEV